VHDDEVASGDSGVDLPGGEARSAQVAAGGHAVLRPKDPGRGDGGIVGGRTGGRAV
jgi:hypothetical protein